eukprot:6134654-Amphidinium_carterae.1
MSMKMSLPRTTNDEKTFSGVRSSGVLRYLRPLARLKEGPAVYLASGVKESCGTAPERVF